MKQKITGAELSALLQSTTYRQFIERVLQSYESSSKPMTYARLARMLGVSSRSYPRDIVLGHKRLTPKLIPRFIKALGLTGDLKAYFIDLVELAEPTCRVSGRSETQLTSSIERVKARILSNSEQSLHIEDAFGYAHLPKIYAALGTSQIGASLEQIQKKTELGIDQITFTLEKMIQLGITAKKGQRYYPSNNHIATTELKKSQVFKQHFVKVAEEAIYSAKKDMIRDDKLFFSSSFSVRSDQLTQLKSELRDVLLRYVDTSENPDGDKVISLLCALH